MKALITGGAGFIGSHLAQRLLKDGNHVVILDNLSTGRIENIEPFKDHPELQFVRADIREASLTQLLTSQCDVVFHLAAAVGVQLIVDDPVRTIETNIGGTETVLEAAGKFGRRVLLASTSEVYGKSDSIPFCEDDDIILGSTSLSRWAYACSKAVDEFLGQAYFQQYGLGVVIARFFNTIGPRQTGRYGMVVPRFVEWALAGEPIRIYGTGQQSRCFCNVHDVVEAVIGLIHSENAIGGIFNIGSSEEVRIEQLADRVIALTDSHSQKNFVPYEVAYGRPIEDMMRRVPSTELIQKAIGWKPRIDLDETLRTLIDLHRQKSARH
jgi:nucleoside-diphosphate-sugar epimerase